MCSRGVLVKAARQLNTLSDVCDCGRQFSLLWAHSFFKTSTFLLALMEERNIEDWGKRELAVDDDVFTLTRE